MSRPFDALPRTLLTAGRLALERVIMKRRSLLLATTVLAVAIGFNGCSTFPEVAARGAVAGHALSGPVDSEVARRFLEGDPLPAELERVRRRLLAQARTPGRRELAEIARRHSPDVATLLFVETVSALPANRALRRRFEVEVASVRRAGIDQSGPNVPDDLLVLLVPGWFYVTHGRDSGADLARQRRLLDRMGVAHRLVKVDENGTVGDNARVVASAIRRESVNHSLLIASASKGGAEVALALGRELSAEDTRAIVGWLSIGGTVRGTPFADRVLEPGLCWFARMKLALEGFDLEGVKSLQTERARPMFESLQIPTHIPVVSYIAAPLSGHVTSRALFGYARMRDSGPNDGLTLLSDEVIPGAQVLLVPGVDHFFQHDSQDVWTAALVRLFAGSHVGSTDSQTAGSSHPQSDGEADPAVADVFAHACAKDKCP